MLKKALVVTSAAIALSAAASLPASATGLGGVANQANTPVTTPEPSFILGSLVVGGIGLFGAKKNSAKSN